jgi:phosphoenolpyruvate carboxylase
VQYSRVCVAQTLLANWKTNPVRSLKPTPEDEARYGISVIEESLWHAVPEVRALGEIYPSDSAMSHAFECLRSLEVQSC